MEKLRGFAGADWRRVKVLGLSPSLLLSPLSPLLECGGLITRGIASMLQNHPNNNGRRVGSSTAVSKV